MELFELKLSTVEDLFSQIYSDINNFQQEGIRESQLCISIPYFVQKFLEYYLKRELYYNGDHSLSRKFYNIEIVPGYNNQICVFYKNATPKSFSVKPIIVDFK